MLIICVIVGSSVGKIPIKNPAGIVSRAHDLLGLLLVILRCWYKCVQRNIRTFNVRDTCETYISAAIRINFLSDLTYFCDEKYQIIH